MGTVTAEAFMMEQSHFTGEDDKFMFGHRAFAEHLFPLYRMQDAAAKFFSLIRFFVGAPFRAGAGKIADIVHARCFAVKKRFGFVHALMQANARHQAANAVGVL